MTHLVGMTILLAINLLSSAEIRPSREANSPDNPAPAGAHSLPPLVPLSKTATSGDARGNSLPVGLPPAVVQRSAKVPKRQNGIADRNGTAEMQNRTSSAGENMPANGRTNRNNWTGQGNIRSAAGNSGEDIVGPEAVPANKWMVGGLFNGRAAEQQGNLLNANETKPKKGNQVTFPTAEGKANGSSVSGKPPQPTRNITKSTNSTTESKISKLYTEMAGNNSRRKRDFVSDASERMRQAMADAMQQPSAGGMSNAAGENAQPQIISIPPMDMSGKTQNIILVSDSGNVTLRRGQNFMSVETVMGQQQKAK